MWEKLKKLGGANVFPTLCYVLAAYFLFAFCKVIGVPPNKPLDVTSGSYLALALFLFMLPEAKKLKLGQLFEYEARVKEIKEDVKQFKEETRIALATYTTLVSAISNTVNQTVNINYPGREEASRAEKDLDSTLIHKTEKSRLEDEVEQFLVLADNDRNYALAKLRIQLEKELRRILLKRQDTAFPVEGNVKFLSTRSLFSQFIDKFSQYKAIATSYDYVLKVCNAAIHGQYVQNQYADEALSMGLRMLEELRRIEP